MQQPGGSRSGIAVSLEPRLTRRDGSEGVKGRHHVAHLLGCESVSLEYPSKRVFGSLTLGIDDGDRIGIVGGNGDGKSTLLGLLAGTVVPDTGRVMRRGGTTIAYLAQTDALDGASTVGHSIVGDTPEHAWASDARIRGIIRGLIADLPWDGCISELSGGQRRRVDLARVLISDCDVLMLDEPTNHLDVAGIAWLADHLRTRWPSRAGALLVVTHDRWLLDEVTETTWEVHSGRTDRYEGGYAAYVLQRVERAMQAAATERKRQNLLRKELAWLARAPQARGTKPKFRVDAAYALIDDEPPLRNALELKQTALSRLGKQVVDVEGVTVRYGTRRVIDDVTWRIGPGDRLGILGENGSGKTTLLKLATGAIKPESGTVRIGSTVRFAWLSQHLDELEALRDERVREVLGRYRTRYEIEGKELTPAQLLERLGFEQAHLSAYVRDLSGGQKRRLQLMLLLLDRPNVLVLDEPDNDLDTDMLALVESLLDTWPGTLLLITHDRHLMERVTDDQFALIDGKLRHLPGGVEEFLRLARVRAGGAQTPGQPARREGSRVAVDDMPGNRASTPMEAVTNTAASAGPSLSRADEYRLKKELASLERKIATATGKVEAARTELGQADPTDHVALIECQGRLSDAEALVTKLEDEWLRISELLV